MAGFSVKVKGLGGIEKASRNLARGGSTLRRVESLMMREAEAIKNAGAARWPRSYNTRGEILTGSAYSKVARKRQHNIPAPSAESFYVKKRIRDGELQAVVFSLASWAYKVRSHQVGESDSQRAERFKWKTGTSPEAYDAQTKIGRKQNAWQVLFVRPFKKRNKTLGAELRAIIEKGL